MNPLQRSFRGLFRRKLSPTRLFAASIDKQLTEPPPPPSQPPPCPCDYVCHCCAKHFCSCNPERERCTQRVLCDACDTEHPCTSVRLTCGSCSSLICLTHEKHYSLQYLVLCVACVSQTDEVASLPSSRASSLSFVVENGWNKNEDASAP
jgi:hypothetical protein